MDSAELNELSWKVLGAGIAVHSALGPGLLESAYEACLFHELQARGIGVAKQVPVPVRYRGVELDCSYRLDLLVEDSLIIEIKAVESLSAIHDAQIISYLKLTGCKVGLLLNFHSVRLKDGMRRFVKDL